MQNDVWLITGGSKGIGLELAKKLLRSGRRVAVTTRAVEAARDALGADVCVVPVDLADEASVGRGVDSVIQRFGRIDVVVNNAGYGQMGAVEEVSDAEARRNFDVNVFGVLNVLRRTLPTLRQQRAGHVFNIGSVGGFTGGFAGWGIYCATKFALSGLTEGLHRDLAPLGVKVTLVYPGYFRTEFLSSDSVHRPRTRIADYTSALESETLHLGSIHQNQPGDPARLAEALIATREMAEPPLHLFLGSDAFGMARDKLAAVERELSAHHELTFSTDFPKA
ncbi:MAG TPA: SDR family NAD(P)-dependent oxidoreductase [Polyangiaceae bacterium]|nr:SDR family NAD(P)-dependent oxidoreductase [Polyangiaceae bacterium]